MDYSDKGDRRHQRVQDLDAKTANVPVGRLSVRFEHYPDLSAVLSNQVVRPHSCSYENGCKSQQIDGQLPLHSGLSIDA
jgi:hypothetical protein